MSQSITEAELLQVMVALPADTPYIITGVSRSMFSVARLVGSCNFQGQGYTYNPVTDELVRNDVLKFVHKIRKEAKKQASQEKAAVQGDLL